MLGGRRSRSAIAILAAAVVGCQWILGSLAASSSQDGSDTDQHNNNNNKNILKGQFASAASEVLFEEHFDFAEMDGHGHDGHGHGHGGDGHHHGHGHGATEQNKEFFNNEAQTYDQKHGKTLDRIIEEIRARLDFIGVDWVDDESNGESEKKPAAPGKQVRLLDYACGTGVVSRALAPYTTQCVGIDLSDGMVAAYNARASNQGLSESEMHAYQGNLCDPNDPEPAAFAKPEFRDFDIAAIGLGLHHFDNPALAIQRLVSRLKKGGVLLVLEFLSHEKPQGNHPAIPTITHHGFSESQMKKMYEDAGVGKDFALQEVSVVFNRGGGNEPDWKRGIFIARGSKL